MILKSVLLVEILGCILQLAPSTHASACPWMCKECSMDDTGTVTCDMCYDEYALKDPAVKTCDPCPSNCVECTPPLAADGKCITCETGYYRDSGNKCQSCLSNCDSCSSSSGLMCDTNGCDTNYIRDDNGECQLCDVNCDSRYCEYNTTLQEASCYFCQSHYTIKDNTECIYCTGCQYCIYNNGAATHHCKCSDYVSNGDNTDSDKYEYVSRGGCGSFFISYVCDEGYYLDTDPNNGVNRCFSCDIDDCIHCHNTGVGIECLDCDTTYNYAAVPMDNGTCYACSNVNNCLNCHYNATIYNEGQCTTCTTGYAVYTDDNGNAICKSCGSFCDKCRINAADGTPGTCSICKDYGVKNHDDDTACLLCPGDCIDCDVNSDGVAFCDPDGCPDRYALNMDSLECERCGDNCQNCKYDAALGRIGCIDTYCHTYYGLLSDGSCAACPNECIECSIVYASDGSTDDVLYCDTCADYYTVNSQHCTHKDCSQTETGPCSKPCGVGDRSITSVCGAEHYYNEEHCCEGPCRGSGSPPGSTPGPVVPPHQPRLLCRNYPPYQNE